MIQSIGSMLLRDKMAVVVDGWGREWGGGGGGREGSVMIILSEVGRA